MKCYAIYVLSAIIVYLHHDCYIRWWINSLGVHMEQSRNFDLLKAFGYTERLFKSEKKIGKDLFYIMRAQRVLSYYLT